MKIGELRAEAVTAAGAVGAALDVIASRVDASHTVAKGPMDITTGTDLMSQAVLREILEGGHPEHGFVGEESGLDARPASGSYWLVDPLCGTRNFTSRLPLYCVNVALVEIDQVVLAVVGDAASDEVWIAERGRGAWAESDGNLQRISAADQSNTVLLDPGRPGGPAAPKAAAVIGAVINEGRWEIRTLGTSLDLAYLAAGRVAAVWHFSKIPPLHFAAGTLLAEEAGAIVTDEDGARWTIASTSLVAAATSEVHHSLLDLLKR